MRTRSFVLATLLVGAAASHALAEESCGDGACADAPRRSSDRDALLRSPDPDVYAEASYDTTGLLDTGDLSHRPLRTPVATAYAAPLVASPDTCMGSRVVGVQVASIGLSVATTWQDENCRRLKNARELFALGYRAAAVQLLCMDDEVYAAMERAGTPCPGVRLIEIAQPPPPPEPSPEPPPLVSIDDVLFDFDRATLRPEADSILDPVLAMLRADPAMSIDIEGHTDWVGSDAYNQGLSERRARAVVDWLVSRGIDRSRISSIGRGEAEPIASNQNAQGRQLNRRVEIRRRRA